MTETEDDEGRTEACHGMLLGLAGRLPDGLMTRCREQLAAGELEELARGVVFCVLSQKLTLASIDRDVLGALLDDPSAVTEVEIDDSDPVIWRFSEEPPEMDEVHEAGAPDGEAREPGPATGTLDQAMAEALTGEAGVIGCWRAWRITPGDAPPAPAKPVFVVEMRADTDLVEVTARLQQRLAAAGEDSPQVEVYPQDWEPPIYQRQARGYGDLIWAAEEARGMQIAGIFDEVDPEHGPRFSPDHARLEAIEAAQVAQYLREAEPVLVTAARMDDVVDVERQQCVPINFRTDGTWIWTEVAAYYAQEHQLEPDPELLAHIRSNDYTVPEVDGVALHRALEALMQPRGEAVWDFDSQPDGDFDSAPGQDFDSVPAEDLESLSDQDFDSLPVEDLSLPVEDLESPAG